MDRLQHILFYRALGLELAEIRAALDDPDFRRLEALQSHLAYRRVLRVTPDNFASC